MIPLGFFRNRPFRYKLLVSYAAVLILAGALGGTIIYSLIRQMVESHIERELRNSTEAILQMVKTSATVSIKNHLRAVAEKNRDVTRHYYRQAQRGLISEAEAQARAAEIMLSQTIGETGYIFVWDIHQAPVVIPLAVHPVIQGQDVAWVDFVQTGARMKNGYIEYKWKNPGELDARDKAMYLSYFKPWEWVIAASSYREEFKRLVNVDDFKDGILSLKFGRAGYSYVMDSEGTVIIHPRWQGRNVYELKDGHGRLFVQDICRRKTGKITYSWRDGNSGRTREKLEIFNYLPQFDWIVVSSGYVEDFYAPVKTVRNIFLATILIAFLVLLPVTFRLSSSITNPLHGLMDRFARGAQGDFSVRMEVGSSDEVGQLSRYFNEFMDRLETFSRKLSESEEKYRGIFENSVEGIFQTSPEGRIISANRSLAEILGYDSVEELIEGISSIENQVYVDSKRRAEFLALLENQGVVSGFEHQFRRKDGSTVWVSENVRTVSDDEGRVLYYEGLLEDISARKAMEAELRGARNYLQNVIDSMPSILIGVDPEGRVTEWNVEAARLSGLDRDEAKGRPLDQALPMLAEQMKLVEECLLRDEPRQVEKLPFALGDATRYFDLVVYPLLEGGWSGAVIRLDDVTGRVRLEEVMVQTEKMMSVGGLAAGMAHEINNPLGGMIQGAQNVIRRLSPDHPSNIKAAQNTDLDLRSLDRYLEIRHIHRLLDGIVSAGRRAARIVTNMLEFSRGVNSEFRPTNLKELLDKTLELAASDYDLKKQYDFRHIRIVRDDDETLPPVPCETTKIEQVVLNLLKNAAQAMTEHKDIISRPSVIVLRTRKEGAWARIEIEDNGPGMSEEVRRRIFEPFYTTKQVGSGTGLGLSVSYFIVMENHGGRMRVESAPGRGAKFIIHLPLVRETL